MKASAQATNRKISWFWREEEAGSLDLSPAFQRRPVWRPEQASYLIDTILSGLPFPEIYLRAQTTSDGQTTYEVVDGQQRIRAILDFAREDLILNGPDVSPAFIGRNFGDFTPDERLVFWNYDVVTRDLNDASDGDIRDLFRRLNIGSVVLNDQELRHAKYTGAFIGAMEKLADDEWWTDNRIVNVRQVRRMEDVEYISEMFVSVMAGPQDKKATLDSFYESFDSSFPDEEIWTARFRHTRDLLESILSPAAIRTWSGKSDFYSLFGALGSFVESGKKWSPASRVRVRAALTKFRNQVNLAKRRDNVKVFPHRVHAYADAVTRAATDAARRKLRLETLIGIIEEARKKA